MSPDKRQLARTQGRFHGGGQQQHQEYKDVQSRDMHGSHRATYSHSKESKVYSETTPLQRSNSTSRPTSAEDKRHRQGSVREQKGQRNVQYIENGHCASDRLEERHAPVVIKDEGIQVLSSTENGESRVYYQPRFIGACEGYELFTELKESTKWFEKKVVINGEQYPQPRLVSWYGPLPYTYSGVTLESREFSETLRKIKEQIEGVLMKVGIHASFNSVLLNLYRDNKDSVAWHSDDEHSMGICPTIASVSLGEVRRFEMRRKSNRSLPNNYAEYVAHLKHGSLIVMDGVMQKDWEHRVPKEYHDKGPRINLTFRTVYPVEKVRRPPRNLETVEAIDEKRQAEAKSSAPQEKFVYRDENFPSLGGPTSVEAKRQSDLNGLATSLPVVRNCEEGSERRSPSAERHHDSEGQLQYGGSSQQEIESSTEETSQRTRQWEKSRNQRRGGGRFDHHSGQYANNHYRNQHYHRTWADLQKEFDFVFRHHDNLGFTERDKGEIEVLRELAPYAPPELIPLVSDRLRSLMPENRNHKRTATYKRRPWEGHGRAVETA